MSKLYHGSYIEVATPFVGLGRKKVDFGQGFYLTKLQSQAQSWAAAIAERKGRNIRPVVSSYNLDYDSIISNGYRIKPNVAVISFFKLSNSEPSNSQSL